MITRDVRTPSMVDWGAGDVMGGERVFKTAVLNDLEILLRGFAYNLDILKNLCIALKSDVVYSARNYSDNE